MNTEGMEEPGSVISGSMGLAQNTEDDKVTLCISVSNLLWNVSLS